MLPALLVAVLDSVPSVGLLARSRSLFFFNSFFFSLAFAFAFFASSFSFSRRFSFSRSVVRRDLSPFLFPFPMALRDASSSNPCVSSLLVVFVLVYCSCTFFGASMIPPLVCIWMLRDPVPARLGVKSVYERNMENAVARECLWMTVLGPAVLGPLRKGSGICRTLMRCWAALAGSAVDAVRGMLVHKLRT